ncbi:hypothetical protein L6164_011325 [Bauhinia variegata]|uniref:Uncharacterized protein n=1 Tax=Bauhinia variegata TaxID=167791 RepID=A0ACB9P6W1_BAUVA|nr:hypothetical protein L6164_011325 [Bauhinia variegata]
MSRSPSFSVKTELSPTLYPESLQRWIVAFCAIRFDLEQGQLVEECYPPGCLTHDEELEIAYSSFPDSVSQQQNRSSIHDCMFFFRFRRHLKSQTSNSSHSEITEVDKDFSPKSTNKMNLSRRATSTSKGNVHRFLYGYVFNRQRHDERLKRGGEQICGYFVPKSLFYVDFRPYFTIHDPEFAHLNSLQEGETFPPMVLGVTNLFFLKALRNIPHIVSVGSPPPNSNRLALSARSSTGRISGRPEGLGHSLKKFSPSSILNAVKLWRDGPLCLMTEHKEAIWITYSASTKPDTSILNRFIDTGMSPRVEESMSVVNNEILQRHFLFKRMRSNWLDLCRQFLKGPNFKPWFQRRRAIADIQQLIAKISELEIVDFVGAIEKYLLKEVQLQQSGRDGADSTAICQKLKGDLQAVFNVLSKDMQQLMLSNLQRASLLQGSHELTKFPGLPLIQVGVLSSSPK